MRLTLLLGNKLPLLLVLAIIFSDAPVWADEATVLGKLAAAMKPGEWAELMSVGYDQATLMRGDDILAYAGKAAWDDVSQQVFFIGQVHLKGPPIFISSSIKNNTWSRQPTPPWAEPLKWFHAYENNAADSARGIFYHHSSNSGLVHSPAEPEPILLKCR